MVELLTAISKRMPRMIQMSVFKWYSYINAKLKTEVACLKEQLLMTNITQTDWFFIKDTKIVYCAVRTGCLN
jgi:hypothetical protein